MSGFRFRLAPLLKTRETQRDQRRLELAAAQRHADSCQKMLAELDANIAALIKERTSAVGPMLVTRLREYSEYETTLRIQRDTIGEELTARIHLVDQCRQNVIEADRDVRALVKLREVQSARHEVDEKRRTQVTLDDLACRNSQC